ncbi:MAG: hypothetical protein HKO13_07995 [Sphingomonas sp.]|nr:hypothetical protein [Sphingomonas sp.]
MENRWLVLGVAAALSAAVPGSANMAAAGEVTPLFDDSSIIEVTLTGPVRSIARRAQRSTKPHEARLDAAGESHAITLAARGKSRRERKKCSFPPLRIAFPEKPGEQSLFYRQGRIKLVTHCRNVDASEQTILREYAAYRLYNRITPESLRVRLARIRYVDDGEVVATRLGFFIEDGDDAARRLGMKEINTGDIPVASLDQGDAARYALFQYMIGNTDWSMVLGPEKSDCCHNSRLFGAGKSARSALTPVPYDFDAAGLVDAIYAEPNERLKTRSVKTRVYRGFCAFNALLPAEADRLRELRPELEAEIAATPYANAATKQEMISYLSGFYKTIDSPETFKARLTGRCR